MIELKMPALSPTMEKGTLAKWLVKPGDAIRPGDLIAEIETDKATMEMEAADEGTLERILIAEGTDDVAVGMSIAILATGDDGAALAGAPATEPAELLVEAESTTVSVPVGEPVPETPPVAAASIPLRRAGANVSPLAARLAEALDIDLGGIAGSGREGRITRADLGIAAPLASTVSAPVAITAPPAPVAAMVEPASDIPQERIKLSAMRKTIARRLTESKQQVPHIYLTVDVRLDALLALRAELNAALAPRGIKLSVNDWVIKALALALIEVPACNVRFADDQLIQYRRADIAVAVSIPNGLITPVIIDAGGKSLAIIATEMQDLAGRAREGRLQPNEYQGGTASLSNLGMFGIKQFDAVINPPQAMILAVGVGERRPWMNGDAIEPATIMSATGSFDHRAIDGADAARLMQAFRRLIETPLLIAG